MPYWMKHPEHGEMPVYDRGEVERVEKFGWVLLNEGVAPQRMAVLQAKPLPHDEPGATIKVSAPEPYKRKPGRPPKAK